MVTLGVTLLKLYVVLRITLISLKTRKFFGLFIQLGRNRLVFPVSIDHQCWWRFLSL